MAFRGTISVAAVSGAGFAWFLLGEQELNYSWPLLFFFAQLGINLLVVPHSVCPFSNFNTSSALGPTDFNSFGRILQGGGSIGVGGIIVNADFSSVVHTPNPIAMAGVDIGLGAGAGWCTGRFKVLEGMTVANAGSTVEVPISALDDSADLSDAIADATADYLQNNTDPTWIQS
jgi:hypothetical protein